MVVEVRLLDLPGFEAFLRRVKSFVDEYAWHRRDCAAVDLDGEWRPSNSPCDCGYDEALAGLPGDEKSWRRDITGRLL
jgi:hypothetical protein